MEKMKWGNFVVLAENRHVFCVDVMNFDTFLRRRRWHVISVRRAARFSSDYLSHSAIKLSYQSFWVHVKPSHNLFYIKSINNKERREKTILVFFEMIAENIKWHRIQNILPKAISQQNMYISI